MSVKMSRRNFVAGAAIAAAGAAASVQAAMAVEAGSVASWDYECDVLVCGSGAGGSAAAVQAAGDGAQVIVIEKRDWQGGQLRRCGGGIAAAGSKVQAALGVEDDPQAFADYWVAVAQGFCDEELAREYCMNSGALVDWIIDDLGGQPVDQWEFCGGEGGMEYEFGPGLNVGIEPEQYEAFGFEPVARCHWFSKNPDDELIERREELGLFPTCGGTGLFKTFADAMDDRGVQVLLETALVRLVVADGTNRVVGVIAEQGGQDVSIKARRGVVVATGNFANNHELHLNYTLNDFEENLWGGIGEDLAGDNDGSGFNACLALGVQPMFTALDDPAEPYSYMCGGLKIDAQARAVDVFGQPVPGLFLSGLTAAGIVGKVYPICGSSIGRNLYFGRVAGASAAAEQPWE